MAKAKALTMRQAMRRHKREAAYVTEYLALKARLYQAYDRVYAAPISHKHGCQMEADALMEQMRELTSNSPLR
jgi:hypothetical protein